MPILTQLLKAEVAEREVRSIAYHMKAVRFPAYKDLAGFDFSAAEINEATVRLLHRCEFIDATENIVLIHCPAVHLHRKCMGGVGLAQVRHMPLRLSVSRQLNTIDGRCASSRPSNWSTRLSRERPVNWPRR